MVAATVGSPVFGRGRTRGLAPALWPVYPLLMAIWAVSWMRRLSSRSMCLWAFPASSFTVVGIVTAKHDDCWLGKESRPSFRRHRKQRSGRRPSMLRKMQTGAARKRDSERSASRSKPSPYSTKFVTRRLRWFSAIGCGPERSRFTLRSASPKCQAARLWEARRRGPVRRSAGADFGAKVFSTCARSKTPRRNSAPKPTMPSTPALPPGLPGVTRQARSIACRPIQTGRITTCAFGTNRSASSSPLKRLPQISRSSHASSAAASARCSVALSGPRFAMRALPWWPAASPTRVAA